MVINNIFLKLEYTTYRTSLLSYISLKTVTLTRLLCRNYVNYVSTLTCGHERQAVILLPPSKSWVSCPYHQRSLLYHDSSYQCLLSRLGDRIWWKRKRIDEQCRKIRLLSATSIPLQLDNENSFKNFHALTMFLCRPFHQDSRSWRFYRALHWTAGAFPFWTPNPETNSIRHLK